MVLIRKIMCSGFSDTSNAMVKYLRKKSQYLHVFSLLKKKTNNFPRPTFHFLWCTCKSLSSLCSVGASMKAGDIFVSYTVTYK